jgi:uncharacterized membrane protein
MRRDADSDSQFAPLTHDLFNPKLIIAAISIVGRRELVRRRLDKANSALIGIGVGLVIIIIVLCIIGYVRQGG